MSNLDENRDNSYPNESSASKSIFNDHVVEVEEEVVEVPSKRSKRLTSAVWEDFNKLKEGDKEIVICKHCKRRFTGASTSGTSHLKNHSDRCPLKTQELAAVFKKIGDKQTCTIGLYELYRITQLYPKVDIFAQLQNASEAFRTYIRDGLAQMEKNAAAGRTPSSLPMPTPPHLALTQPSPKCAPLSPVHTKSVVNTKPDPINSNLQPSSFFEDDGGIPPVSVRAILIVMFADILLGELVVVPISQGVKGKLKDIMNSLPSKGT